MESFSIAKETTEAKITFENGKMTTTETNGLTHSCLVGDTLISTNKGELRLDEVVNRVTMGDTIYAKTYNVETGKIEENKILAGAMTRKNAKLLKVKYDGKEIICTPDHKIFTKNRGYVEAKDLLKDDILVGL